MSMNNPELDRIVAKIQRLKALAGNNTNTNEAAQAAAAVQNLMFKYNLTELDVVMPIEDDIKNYERVDYDVLGRAGSNKRWRANLIHAVAKFNFCRVINITNTYNVAIIGKPANIEVCLYLFEYLAAEIVRLCDVERAKDIRNMFINGTEWNMAFGQGAVSAIYDTLKAQQEQDKAANGSGTAMVLQSDIKLTTAVDRLFGNTVKGKTKYVRTDVFNKGYEEGQKINISKGITGTDNAEPAKQLTSE